MEAIEADIELIQTHTTPLKAVRKYCLWCACGQAYEVRLCTSTDCPLWGWRYGHKPAGGGSTLRVIRARCLDCSGYSTKDVRECWDKDCTLYPYRMGHNPKLAGKGNLDALVRWQAKQKTPAHRRIDGRGGLGW